MVQRTEVNYSAYTTVATPQDIDQMIYFKASVRFFYLNRYSFRHSPHQPVYTATKHGVIGFSRAIAQEASEQGNYGVRINTLCPAFVDTQLLHTVEHEETMGKFVKYKDEFKQLMDTYGILKPSLIAEGMLRMITDESLNGAVMKITCSKGIHFHTYEPLSA